MDENQQYDAELLLLLAAAAARWRRLKVREDRDNIATSCPEFENIMWQIRLGPGRQDYYLMSMARQLAEAFVINFVSSDFRRYLRRGISDFGSFAPICDYFYDRQVENLAK